MKQIKYNSSTDEVFSFDYGYTKNGNINSQNIAGKVSTYSYDKTNQLVKEILPNGVENSYKYDAVGNRLSSTVNGKTDKFTYNEANQIQTKNDVQYIYDADGNLLKDENYKYTYNEMQQLVSVKTLDDKKIASYTYDENGLRLTKTVGDKVYEYFYNNEVLEMEIVKEKGNIIAYRYYEWDGTTPLGSIVKTKDSSGNWKETVYHYWTNHRGDILSIRDNNGKEVGSYEYDAYGNILKVEGDIAKENPIRYAGYYYDDETKNYYLQARYYNPVNGAFLALDPYPGDDDDPLSQNGYTYAINNPINFIDPDGHNPIAAWAIRLAVRGITYWGKRYGVPLFRATTHLAVRMIQRGISPLQIAKTLYYGKKYYDPKYKSIVYYWKGIAVARKGRVLTTTYRGFKKRWRKL
ncbi:hypothetical protein J6TS2_49050 [Heyndrickxia sporothermodurans]|nr:hypothetical protein J6TS2_49050 [Heyndrickxia sporothermodurans]